MARWSLRWLMLAAVGVGCQGGHDQEPAEEDAGGSPDAPVPPDATFVQNTDAAPAPDAGPVDYPFSDLDEGCAPIFRQSIVPDYHLTIAPDEWAAMQQEFMNPQFTPGGSIIDPPYHHVQLHIVEGDAEHDPTGVMMRITGNTSWLHTILYDDNPKMQFMVAFNEIDPDGRFQGLRKIKLDMPRSDWTFIQQRVGVAWLRGRAGVPAPCANSARVFINGAYYGLYTNLERQDKSFLGRVYGDFWDGGDLWKGGRSIATNEDSFSWAHLSAFWDIEDLEGLDALTDLDVSMLTWASEAVIGDCDGYNYGRANFYLYDHPEIAQFVWLATDLDTVLDADYLEPDATPVFRPENRHHESDWEHFLIALNDPEGVVRYVDAMSEQLPKLDPAELTTWIDAWSAQIADAAAADPHRPFSMADHDEALDDMQSYALARADYLDDWVDCWESGGADADGDGFDMCHDCNDGDATQSPGDVEVCDDVDNDCNGVIDDVAGECPDIAAAMHWVRIFTDRKAAARAAKGR
jgi:hypothetical protein